MVPCYLDVSFRLASTIPKEAWRRYYRRRISPPPPNGHLGRGGGEGEREVEVEGMAAVRLNGIDLPKGRRRALLQLEVSVQNPREARTQAGSDTHHSTPRQPRVDHRTVTPCDKTLPDLFLKAQDTPRDIQTYCHMARYLADPGWTQKDYVIHHGAEPILLHTSLTHHPLRRTQHQHKP